MRFSFRITAFFMAILVLISGTGLAISTHHCGSDQKTEVELNSRNQGCCSSETPTCETKPQQGVQSDCCQLNVRFEKIDLPSVGNKLQISFTEPATILFDPHFIIYRSGEYSIVQPDSPPLKGRTSLFCCLII
jgi:hypothetical protein